MRIVPQFRVSFPVATARRRRAVSGILSFPANRRQNRSRAGNNTGHLTLRPLRSALPTAVLISTIGQNAQPVREI